MWMLGPHPLEAGLQITTTSFFTKFGRKVADGLRKKALDFRGNPDSGVGTNFGVGGAGEARPEGPRAGV